MIHHLPVELSIGKRNKKVSQEGNAKHQNWGEYLLRPGFKVYGHKRGQQGRPAKNDQEGKDTVGSKN